MKHSNIEIKARIDDPNAISRALTARGARHHGTDHQIDTYFAVPAGRLKVREGTIENCLVYYERPDIEGPKPCSYRIVRFEHGDERPAQLRELLAMAYGILVVVEKNRDIYYLDNLKLHVDEVPGLGAFFEIEAGGNGTRTPGSLTAQCHGLMADLAIERDALVSRSYSDLLISRNSG